MGTVRAFGSQFAASEIRKPLSVLTPYHRFTLPDDELIKEIQAHSGALYSTCAIRSGAELFVVATMGIR